MENIAIVGVAQTKYERRKKDQIYYDLVYEVTKKALEDAGFTLDDIDNVITVSNDFFDGRTISSMAVGEATGAMDAMLNKIAEFYSDEVDTAVDGLTALMEPAIMVILGGLVGGLIIAMYLPIFSMAGNI